MDLTTTKKEMILETIEVRLENVKDVTKRSRLAFLVTTIASCAILITMWNAYFSTVRGLLMDKPAQTAVNNQTNSNTQINPNSLATTTNTQANANIQANTQTSSNSESQPLRIPLPIYEHNRRELAAQWVNNTNVSINLLGIDINVNDFPLIGSFSLFVITFWLFFTNRRENRAIVSLLRDVKYDLKFPPGIQEKGDDKWDIANFAFHGAANSLIFFTTGTNDKPMSDKDIFDRKAGWFEWLIDWSIGLLTKIIRFLVGILIFLPFITIAITIGVDEYSTNNIESPFRKDHKPPISYMQENNQISLENTIGRTFGFVTFFICLATLIFQLRTSAALREFETALDCNKPWTSDKPPSKDEQASLDVVKAESETPVVNKEMPTESGVEEKKNA